MQILIISGFLGSGKTTFIKEMSKATGREFVVVENEFSDLNIDGPILNTEENKGKLTVRELTEGCICCSSTLDFRSTILTIANSLNPDILLVEPSGVAFPSRILGNLKQICYDQIGLLEPITIVDGEHYPSYRKDFKTYFDNQIQTAKNIIISKSEKYKKEDFQLIKEDLQVGDDINFPFSHYSQWSQEDWTHLFKNEAGVSIFKQSEIEADTSIENMSFPSIKAKTPEELVGLLHEFNTGKYGYILRSKGYFKGHTDWFRYDYVNGTYMIGSCPEMPNARAVVIGKNLKKNLIKKLFDKPNFSKDGKWLGEAMKFNEPHKRVLKRSKRST